MDLYISDLDGTLLGSDARLSDFSLNAVNSLIADGINFSVATARTYATVKKILCGVNFKIPVILMNGALIFDVQNQQYVFKAYIDKENLAYVTSAIHLHKVSAFMYTVENSELTAYYEQIANEPMRKFYEERKYKYYKKFEQISSLDEIREDVVYFSILDTQEKLSPLYDDLQNIQGIKAVFYQDVYSENLWYLEIFSLQASKKNAVNFLKERYSFDKVYAFGDNLNDLSLFEASDFCCAVENANEKLKAKANQIIGSNDNDGVAKYLLNKFGKDF
ncbi:MAG: HAD family hydrolase [Oscillospiraceae bacterium]